MRFDKDPSRAALLRDLLMNYETTMRRAENAPMPPEGLDEDPDMERAFWDRWENDPRSSEFIEEGNYPNAENGRPDATITPDGPVDFEQQQMLQDLMPTVDDHIAPIPLKGPGNGRPRALAEMLRRK